MGRPHPLHRAVPRARSGGRVPRRDRIRIAVGRLARRAGLERHSGRDGGDRPAARVGRLPVRHCHLADWQGDVAPDAGFNPLRYAREMTGARRLLASRKHGCDTRQPPPTGDHVRPGRSMSKTGVTTACPNPAPSLRFPDSSRMELSYCRVSTTAQDLTRQIDAMPAAGIAEEHIYVAKRTGAPT